MAVISTVNVSTLRGARRFDADRYHVDYLRLEHGLVTLPNTKKLKVVIDAPVRTGHTPRDRDMEIGDEEICFIKTDTLREGVMLFDSSDVLPARCLTDRSYLRPSEVVVTIIGAEHKIIGRAALFLAGFPRTVVNQNVSVIRPNEALLDPYYLMAFLNCEYGRRQLWMLSRQTEQVNLNCREVEEVVVPLFNPKFQTRIQRKISKFYEGIEQSGNLYIDAEKLLLKELKLDSFNATYELHYTANAFDTFDVARMDAEHFQPVIGDMLNHLSGVCECRSLATLAPFIEHGKQPPYDDEGDIYVFSQKYIRQHTIDYDFPQDPNLKCTSSSFATAYPEFVLKKDDVLHYSVGGNIGRCQPYLEPEIKAMPGSFITLIRPDPERVDPLYLASVMNSIVGRLQTDKWKSASAQPYIYPKDIGRFVIPIVSEKRQKHLALKSLGEKYG